MISRSDQLTVLSRIIIPLIDVAEEKSYKITFNAYTNFCSFAICYKFDKNIYQSWSCFYDATHDWDCENGHFRTFESMKEILLTIREALENE